MGVFPATKQGLTVRQVLTTLRLVGVLEEESTGETFEMPSRLIVGRSEHADLRLKDARVSGEHASLYFEKRKWIVRDLASRNGTTVNGTELKARDRRQIALGARVCFGASDQCWILVDDAAPDESGIAVTVQSSFELGQLSLRFRVSPEEENVSLSLLHKNGTTEVPNRAYHYLLLTLARSRIADRDQGLEEDEQGWVHTDELVPGLYPDIETLNVNIYRARRLFSELGVRDSKNLVERRSGSGHLRLGARKIRLPRPSSEGPRP